jgi:hypothetical protein
VPLFGSVSLKIRYCLNLSWQQADGPSVMLPILEGARRPTVVDVEEATGFLRIAALNTF